MSTPTDDAADQRLALCKVVFAHLDVFRRAHESVLDGAERSRATRFRHEADRVRFVLGSAVARAAAAAELAVPTQEIELNRSCPDCGEPHRKPYVVGHDLELSIAHSGDLVVVAYSSAGPVGVDVESCATARRLDHRDLGPAVCSQPIITQEVVTASAQ